MLVTDDGTDLTKRPRGRIDIMWRGCSTLAGHRDGDRDRRDGSDAYHVPRLASAKAI